MLILTRKPGQRIVINGNIIVEILKPDPTRGSASSIRIGVTAPENVSVDREEVHLLKVSRGEAK